MLSIKKVVGKVMLVVKKISKSFGDREVIKDVSFCLKKGEIIALLGPNGAGKTTLMKSIIGFYETDQGDVILDNVNLSLDRKKVLSKIAYVPENGGIYPEMSVFEYLTFMANIKHLDKDESNKKISLVAKQLELESVINQRCETLSKGYKRRVAIAGAMLTKPEVLILDEPTEGLDPQQKQHLRSILKNYKRDCMVLISTHVMEEVDALADRVILLKDGKIVCDTTPDDLKKATPLNTIENSFCTILSD